MKALEARNLTDLPFGARRYPVVGRRGMVATSEPRAARAGLAMLEQGGNAVDAAIAAAVTLTVVEPTSNGIGGDAFALVWDGSELQGYNGSGRAPAALTLERVQAAGHAQMPETGWLPVTVPGAPRAWADLHDRYALLSFDQLFAPALRAAEEGFAVSPVVAENWGRAHGRYTAVDDPALAGWAPTFAPAGRAPAAGELWRSSEMASTLRAIARSQGDDFYVGSLAERMVRFAQESGGLWSAADLAAHRGQWVDPIHAALGEHEIHEIPPSGQGIAALIALNLLGGMGLDRFPRDSVESYHLQIEAMKLAFADAERYVADPDVVDVPVEALLEPAYAHRRRAAIGERAGSYEAGVPRYGGTVYLAAVDGEGMMVSYIQSNYMGFGSGIVVPGTGIALHNRGAGFRLEPDHPNVLSPGKRPYHTIIPAFLTRGGDPIGPFGVMGGAMQPQGHLQVALGTLLWGLNPQAVLDAPRWRVMGGRRVLLEIGTPRHIVEGLAARGHEITIPPSSGHFGRGQIIWRRADGCYVAGTESRADSLALAQ